MLSFSDLTQLGAYSAIEYCGGPQMNFRMGRVDEENETNLSPHDRIPSLEEEPAH